MVAFSKLTGALAAVALGGAALIAAPAAALAQPAATVVVPCDTGALDTAITAANGAVGATTLQLSSNCTYTIFTPATAVDGLPPITGDITLAGGQNTVIRRSALAKAFRLIEVGASGDLTITNLSLNNGSAALLAVIGGFGPVGGAILDAGDLSVTNSTISGNTALNGGGVYVAKGASATISSTLMNLNTTFTLAVAKPATPTQGNGGAVYTDGDLRLFNTVIDSNTAADNGGGLYVDIPGTAVTEQTTVTNNTASNAGGGIANTGSLSLSGSQVRLNVAGNIAGGIVSNNTDVSLTSTIVRKNTPDNCAPTLYCVN
jgi:hypothetical protein